MELLCFAAGGVRRRGSKTQRLHRHGANKDQTADARNPKFSHRHDLL
jgi:hypothetical protein